MADAGMSAVGSVLFDGEMKFWFDTSGTEPPCGVLVAAGWPVRCGGRWPVRCALF